MSTTAIDTKQLWRSELKQAGHLGFTVHISTEEQTGRFPFRAVCVLKPETPRARLVCAAHGAEQIEGYQDFEHREDVVFAHGDAMRAALTLAKDAS